MDFNLLLRNRGVHRVLVGVPEGGDRLAARIETASGDVVTLEESTLAALARAYLHVTTHPTARAVELVATAVRDRKDGFGEIQLLDAGTDEGVVREELASGPTPAMQEPPTHPPAAPTPMPLPARAAAPAALATEHGRPPHDETDDLDLELDDAEEEPIFGDVPTHHSKPRTKR
jgi:hypothetical protein